MMRINASIVEEDINKYKLHIYSQEENISLKYILIFQDDWLDENGTTQVYERDNIFELPSDICKILADFDQNILTEKTISEIISKECRYFMTIEYFYPVNH
ncbi:hypothetical protein [Parafilimonas sp.]|uniref:hypothetical protein n=1 Tax=Parafilimonas sp. TaxID=1969739 RepID=UPI0039E563B1